MKKIALIILLHYPIFLNAQSFEWIETIRLIYSLNPAYPEYAIDFDEQNNKVIHSRLDSFDTIYGSTAYGKYTIESRDTNSILDWYIELWPSVNIQRVAVNTQGEIFVGGQMLQTLHITPNDTLGFVPTTSTTNFFLIKLDSLGNVIWKRNLSSTWPNFEGIEALTVDPSNNCWYATTDFFESKIALVDGAGNDFQIRTIQNAKRIGNISFDMFGGMYVSGSASSGNFVMGNSTFTVPYSYAMFLARYSPSGQPSWAKFGNDITFQDPMVVADPLGNAIFSGMRYDSLNFNGSFIPSPYLSSDFFVIKTDTAGNVLWAVFQPPLAIGPFGLFESGTNLFIDTDADGNIYMGGLQQGTVDWGNGYISSTTGFTDKKLAVACIDSTGSTQWVKMGGGNYSNYLHAVAVSDRGSTYFTGSFRDTASYDWYVFETQNDYNFLLGKIRILPVGLEENNNTSDLTVFPNPTNNVLNLTENALGSDIVITDITGRIVLAKSNIDENKIDVSFLTQGVYILKLRKSNAENQIKFVINR